MLFWADRRPEALRLFRRNLKAFADSYAPNESPAEALLRSGERGVSESAARPRMTDEETTSATGCEAVGRVHVGAAEERAGRGAHITAQGGHTRAMTTHANSAFGPFNGRVWLDCAHQGPLPKVAVRAAEQAIADKVAPHRIADARFREVPRRLKTCLGELVGVAPDEIIVANSASYGLHLLANGLPLREGDEVLLMKGDFPSDILPWLALRERGVRVQIVEPSAPVLQPEDVAANLTPATRVLCTTWVHSFSGWGIDIEAVGELCRSNETWFVVNASQAVGARPIDLSALPIDAFVSVGFKWLCGPYGTGFAWLSPELLDRLRYNQAYWLSMLSDDDLSTEIDVDIVAIRGAAKYDVFGTANFLNFEPWIESVRMLLDFGISVIAQHDQDLVSGLVRGLDALGYTVLSPRDPGVLRSTLVVASHKDRARNPGIHRALREAGIDISLRNGVLRFAPHVYNAQADIDRALETLRGVGT